MIKNVLKRWKEGGTYLATDRIHIRMDLAEVGINEGKWVESAKNRKYWRALVNAALNLRVSYAMERIFGGG